jgi:hypothetical protein
MSDNDLDIQAMANEGAPASQPLQIINIYSISRKTGLASGCDTNYSKGDVNPM